MTNEVPCPECPECNKDLAGDAPPPVADEAAWRRIAKDHDPDCQWVASRAGRLPITYTIEDRERHETRWNTAMGDGVEVYTTLADAEEALAIAQEGRPHREFRIVPSYDPAAELDPEA